MNPPPSQVSPSSSPSFSCPPPPHSFETTAVRCPVAKVTQTSPHTNKGVFTLKCVFTLGKGVFRGSVTHNSLSHSKRIITQPHVPHSHQDQESHSKGHPVPEKGTRLGGGGGGGRGGHTFESRTVASQNFFPHSHKGLSLKESAGAGAMGLARGRGVGGGAEVQGGVSTGGMGGYMEGEELLRSLVCPTPRRLSLQVCVCVCVCVCMCMCMCMCV